MREIKFRVFDKDSKKMWMPDLFHGSCGEGGWYLNLEGTLYERHDGTGGDFEVENIVLMQYTGLKDKNGKKIYEGDIISVVDIGDIPSENSRHQVVYCGEDDYPAFDLKPHIDCDSNGLSYLKAGGDEEMIILGNIYENPELIKEK